MIGVIGDRRGLEMVDRVAAPVVVVGELFPQAVDVVAPTLERQVSEHVIKRAVLEHQDDDVVDLPQIGHADVLRHHHTPRRGLRSYVPGTWPPNQPSLPVGVAAGRRETIVSPAGHAVRCQIGSVPVS